MLSWTTPFTVEGGWLVTAKVPIGPPATALVGGFAITTEDTHARFCTLTVPPKLGCLHGGEIIPGFHQTRTSESGTIFDCAGPPKRRPVPY
jgi:hypothetical protein